MNTKIDNSWQNFINAEQKKAYFIDLEKYIDEEIKNQIIYPEKDKIFNALSLCPIEKTKVVIIGQDPYHEPGQANGLSFSVEKGTKIPPSLRNILKEIDSEMTYSPLMSGDLERWAKQGVLLLNSILTVRAHSANSHKNKGWETFTNDLIYYLSNKKKNIVYLLWGAYAEKKSTYINTDNNLILKSAHPSPLSSYRGFFGNNHFIETNKYLKEKNIEIIDWR